MIEFNIAIITPLSGPSESVGVGIKESFKFEIEKQTEELKHSGIVVNLKLFDDLNNPIISEQKVIEAINEDCVVILGPSDSACAAHVLKGNKFKDVPFLITYATDVKEEFTLSLNSFRFTTPGSERSEYLLNRLTEENPHSDIQIFSLKGSPESFSQSAKSSIEKLCLCNNLKANSFDFFLGSDGITAEFSEIKNIHLPIILCSPSLEGMMFVKAVRDRGFTGKIYGFGANKNWLKKECRGITLICDINRSESNPEVANIHRRFEESHPTVHNPSIATMLAARVITQVFKTISIENKSKDIKSLRKSIIKILEKSSFKGIGCKKMGFTSEGEMEGFESIALQTVMKTQKWLRIRLGFKEAKIYQTNIYVRWWNKETIKEAINIAGFVIAVIGLVLAIIMML